MNLRSVIKEEKNFNSVKPGDVGEDYGGREGEVVAKGKGKVGLNKFKRAQGYDDIKDLIDSGDIDAKNVELVVVEVPGEQGQILYVYGDDGFVV